MHSARLCTPRLTRAQRSLTYFFFHLPISIIDVPLDFTNLSRISLPHLYETLTSSIVSSPSPRHRSFSLSWFSTLVECVDISAEVFLSSGFLGTGRHTLGRFDHFELFIFDFREFFFFLLPPSSMTTYVKNQIKRDSESEVWESIHCNSIDSTCCEEDDEQREEDHRFYVFPFCSGSV